MADPVIINPTLTLAGQKAAFNASNNGLELTITHVSFGTAHYDPDGNEEALTAPVGNKVAVAGASRPTPYQIRMVSAWREDVGQVGIGEIGFWADDVLVFVWSKADGTVASYKTNGVTYVLFNDLAFGQVPANSISFVIDPDESVALAAIAAHEGANNAHPQYVLRAKFPDYQGHLWGEVGGTANAITLTLPAIVELTQYITGNRFSFKAASTNTGATTINIDGVGAVEVLKTGGVPLTAGSIVAGGVYDVYYDGAKFQLTAGAGFASSEATEAEVTELKATESTSWLSVRRLIKALLAYARLDGATFTGAVKGLTPAQFDSSTQFATTEFVQRAGGNFSSQTSLTAPTSITRQMAGSRIVVDGSGALTLPLFKDVPVGSVFYIVNTGASTFSITPQGTEKIVAFANTLSKVDLATGATAIITRGVATYVLEEGTEALQYSTSMSKAVWTTQSQFDNSRALATTAFVKRQGVEFSSYNSLSVSTALGPGSVGGIISAASATAINVTLPSTAEVATGAVIQLVSAGAGAITVLAPNGSSITNASGVGISAVLKQGDTALFCKVASEWRLVSGSLALKHAAAFGAVLNTLAQNYQILPSGDIEQWGMYVSIPAGSNVVIPLQVTMAAVASDVQLTFANSGTDEAVGTAPVLQYRGSSQNSITVRNLHSSSVSFYWRVKGRV